MVETVPSELITIAISISYLVPAGGPVPPASLTVHIGLSPCAYDLFDFFICRFEIIVYLCSGETNMNVYEHKWFECNIA